MTTLNLNRKIVAFEDMLANNNPSRRSIDWTRAQLAIPVDNAGAQPKFTIAPLSELAVFSSLRTTGIDVTTQLTIGLTGLAVDQYRMDWTGGTAPGFRTDRGLTLSGGNITFTVQSNSTVIVTHAAGAVFGAVQVGDIVFVPGLTTDDTSLFDYLNEGEWSVLAATATQLTLVRLPGAIFTGATEVVTLTTNLQVIAYSSDGVQVGDTIDISAGFSQSSRHSYKVVFVTSGRIDFTSSVAVAEEVATPNTGIKVYSAAKKWVYIEADQEVAVKFNGSTDENNRIVPWVSGDDNQVGCLEKTGTVYSLSIKNRSTSRVTILFASAE